MIIGFDLARREPFVRGTFSVSQYPVLTALLLTVFSIGFVIPAQANPPMVTVTIEGPEQTVFDWSKDACETWDVPDAPARAFRDAEGRVHLIASHSTNRAAVGPDLNTLTRDCHILFQGNQEDSPDKFDDRAWLSGFYTEDGLTVYALVHNEYQGYHRPALCPSRTYIRCWRNAITFAISRDSGQTFVQPEPPSHLIATPPYRYEGDYGRNVGYFNPTNILRKDGAYFAMFSAAQYHDQEWGACIMRSQRLDDPTSWRAWDGKAFTVQFRNAYKDTIADPARHVCAPVGKGKLVTPLGGIVRHTGSGAFIAVMAGTRRSASGIYASASHDLIEWSDAVLLWQLPTNAPKDGCPVITYHHPSLIDPTSADRNFATVGDLAQLYVMTHNFKNCRASPDRDLLRVPVRITVTPRQP